MARWHRILPLIAVTVILAACGAQEPNELPAPEDPASEEQAMDSEQPRQVSPEEQGSEESEGAEEVSGGDRGSASELEDQTDLAIEDASSSTGVSRQDITVAAAERVTWNDGSLGCPAADGVYTQALVEGYRIILSVDGRERAYHGQDGKEPFYCANPQEPSGGGTVDR